MELPLLEGYAFVPLPWPTTTSLALYRLPVAMPKADDARPLTCLGDGLGSSAAVGLPGNPDRVHMRLPKCTWLLVTWPA